MVTAKEAFCESFFRFLNGKKEPPGLAVDRDPDITHKRRWHTHVIHHIKSEPVFHITVVLKGRIQRKFVETVVILGRVMIHLHLETVTFKSILLSEAAGIIAFGAQTNILKTFAINDQIGRRILFLRRRIEKSLPVIDLDIDGMDTRRIKEARFIARRF